MLPSELTNTIKQFIVYVHRNEPHFTYIYVYHTMYLTLTTFTKTLPKCNFTYNFVPFLFRSGAPPMTLLNDRALTDPQLPATHFTLVHDWCKAGWRRPGASPNTNPGYAGDFDGSEIHSKGNTCWERNQTSHVGNNLHDSRQATGWRSTPGHAQVIGSSTPVKNIATVEHNTSI